MKYFKFEQWAVSSTAKQKGIDNSVPPNFQPRVKELVEKILDPLREAWGSDITVTSGYRSAELNKAVGGSNTSAHSQAYAADLVPVGRSINEFALFVMHWLHDNNIVFDQFIDEHKPNSAWVHVAIRNGGGQQRKQYLLYKSWLPKGQQYKSINPNLYTGSGEKDIKGSSTTSRTTQTGQTYNSDFTTGGGNTQDRQTYNSGFTTGGGNTQTGSTENILQGRSVYYKDFDIEYIKNNAVFAKDENGEPLTDANGNYIPDDSYLIGSAENESDELVDITDIPAEPVEINLEAIESDEVEQVKGISFSADGSYVVSHSKTIQEILAMVQQWWELVQRLKNTDFQNLIKQSKVEETHNEDGTVSVNAMVYMKAAFDMYGHAYREGMTCPVCGKKLKYLPPGGYCSPACMLKAAKDKSLAFLRSPNNKYKWFQNLIAQLCAILDQTTLMINAIVMIPDIVKELASLPEEYKQYVQNKIAEGFAELQELIQKAMVYKNELLGKILKPINFGVIPKPVAMSIGPVQDIQESLEAVQHAFDIVFSAIKIIIDKLSAIPTLSPGLVLPAESFAWALTPRSFLSPMPYTNPDTGKIFVVLPGGSGAPIEAMKPMSPSALESINIQAIDSIVQSVFPPLTPLDYYLEPELFEIRYLFSDQSNLVSQLRQQLEDFLKCGPDYIPNFENLLPVKMMTFTINGEKKDIPMPNIGYLWFLLGLMDAWAPHSQALVGSLLNPAI